MMRSDSQDSAASEPASDIDDDAMAAAFTKPARGQEKDGKGKTAPKVTIEDGYLFVDGEQVAVNGCWVYRAENGSLRAAGAGGKQFAVLRGSAAVTSWAGLTYDRGLAKIGSAPLSLRGWDFAWEVVIADTEKYEQAAFDDFRGKLTTMKFAPGQAGQCFAYIENVKGHRAHVSVDARDMRAEIRKLMSLGRTPSAGFLSSANFHVTVEVYGRNNPANPRIFANSTEWQGNIDRLQGVGPASVIAKGGEWLRSNM
jgi:hypothetical protein